MILLAYNADGELLARIETHAYTSLTTVVWMPANCGNPTRETAPDLETARGWARDKGATELVTVEELE